MAIETVETEEITKETLIKVIGVGGGGGNAVEHMIKSGVQGVEFVCVNTDVQALAKNAADHSIQLGSNGLGAGAKPEVAREAAEAAETEIRQALQGAQMVFITAGFGGGTGTGAAPVIARIAKEMNILTVGVITKPFTWEGPRRMRYANAAVQEMEQEVHSQLVLLNSKLEPELGEDVKQHEAFAKINDVLKFAVGGICDIIYNRGEVNADFEDVRTVMSEPGRAMMGTGTATGPDRARIATEQAIACPLLEGVDLTGAKGILVLLSSTKENLKLSESRIAMTTVGEQASEDAHIIYGLSYDESLGETIRVTVIATGLANPDMRRQTMQVLQGGGLTGTDGGLLLQPSADSLQAIGGHGDMPLNAATLPKGSAVFTQPVAPQPVRAASNVFRNARNTRMTAPVEPQAQKLKNTPGAAEAYEIPAFLRQAD